MIQRIQSIYFLIAALLDGGEFFDVLYAHATRDPQKWIGYGFSSVLIVSGILALVCIFLFGNRKNQIKWSDGAIFFQTIALGWGLGILLTLGGFGFFLWRDAVGAFILLLSLVALLLARRRIKKDQKLVDSMNRIR